ncbi:hypothetical protein [Mesorhizobium sp. dw_380]|nr:hypothetical protein [Mesorhizobium sp. dw_380]
MADLYASPSRFGNANLKPRLLSSATTEEMSATVEKRRLEPFPHAHEAS